MKRPRANPNKQPVVTHRKRPRFDKPAKPVEDATQSGQRRRVKLDDLDWSTVDMPDRLDDFEGFFGLEEIDGVDVVKDMTTGLVTFESSKPLKVHADDDAGDNDEWEGFDDQGEDAVTNGNNQGENYTPGTIAASTTVNDVHKADDVKSESNKQDGQDALRKSEKPKKEKKKKQKEKEKEKDQKKINSDNVSMNGKSAWDLLADKPMDDDEDEDVDVSEWEGLGLSADILEALSKLKFSRPTTIQSSAIPEIMAGHDVIGKAVTGSGKTLAFGIPILEAILAAPKTKKKAPTALIVSPTRELAHQITTHLTALGSKGSFDAPSIATITGGLSVQKQRRQLETADIVVGTPGRLWEVMSSGHGQLDSFKRIRFLVIDEADRLLGQGHFKELGEIINVLKPDDAHHPENEPGSESESESESESNTASDTETTTAPTHRQTLVFSATFQKNLSQKLAGKGPKGSNSDLMTTQESLAYLLRTLPFNPAEKPKFLDASPTSQMAPKLTESLIECGPTEKDLYLYTILLLSPKTRALVFTNSIAAVRRITPFLANLNLPAFPLHSQMPQKARLRSIERFTQRPGSILVATDVAARGLDIPQVQLIVHYHLPRAADTYVHRSGRTARAGMSGSSVLLCGPEEVAGVRRLVAKVHARSQPSSSSSTSTPGTKESKTQKRKKNNPSFYIRTLPLDRRLISRLKPRATLSKTLADAVLAKEKSHSENDFMREAAEDLGVEYDSETFEDEGKGKRGRGSARRKKEREAKGMSKGEFGALRAELRGLLAQRVNVGVSERYLTNGGVDVEGLLRGEGLEGGFLGRVDALGLAGEDDEDEDEED
ncbi:P-loop containing nucleoside triphosphate hydrolase protein [Dendryphion nanum]|uniref:ATP-dependent RNA helicase n=1 Tax=Dendryphion nanum TaxID=256645 RepID=A0A9P9CYE0_9PLEO|nr:P-loop containing nucleoside triphosphate hydrolase protein [Dendryphion nanum]